MKDLPRKVRCAWASGELSVRYHDEEWGVPVHDDRTLFEFLILEGAQAGLSWTTILNKRENYRKAFDGFDPKRVAKYDRRKTQQLLRDPGIVRNKLKVASAVGNAKAFLHVQKEFGSFRPLHLAIRRRQAARERPQVFQGCPGEHARIRCHEQRPEEARLQIRRHRPSATPSCKRWEW